MGRCRLDTLQAVRDAGLNACCGGILGLGENELDRAQLLHTLATLPQHPESVPINQLVQIPGTPLYGAEKPRPLDFVRVIAMARLLMPASHVRLSAGRSDMTDETQALCFLAGEFDLLRRKAADDRQSSHGARSRPVRTARVAAREKARGPGCRL
jgi:biotin synthase